MASTETSNLGLVKQDYNGYTSVFDLNDNMDKIDDAFAAENLMISISNLSALPHTVANSKITASHKVVMSLLSNGEAMAGSEWTYQTSEGSLKIMGTISDTTNVDLYLVRFF